MIPVSPERSQSYEFFLTCDKVPTTSTNSNTQIVKGTGGTLALASTGGPWLNIPTAASAANDYQLIGTVQPFYVLKANKPISFECVFKCTEAATNGSVLSFGLSSTLATGFMQAATAGPPASFTGAVFYKISGSMALGFRTSAGTVNTDNPTFATLVSGTVYTLHIEIGIDGTNAYCTPGIGNGAMGLVETTLKGSPLLAAAAVRQSFAWAGLGPLYAFAAVNTSTTSAETLSLSYLACNQIR